MCITNYIPFNYLQNLINFFLVNLKINYNGIIKMNMILLLLFFFCKN